MTGKAGAPLTEAMFYVLMALRRGELWRHGDRRMDGAVYGGAGPSGAGDAVYHLGAFFWRRASFRRRRCRDGSGTIG